MVSFPSRDAIKMADGINRKVRSFLKFLLWFHFRQEIRSKWLLASTENLHLSNMALFRSRDAIKMADCCQSFYGRGGSVTETWDWLHAILTTGPLGQTSYRTRRRVGVDGNWWLFDCATAFPFFFRLSPRKVDQFQRKPAQAWMCGFTFLTLSWGFSLQSLAPCFFLSFLYVYF